MRPTDFWEWVLDTNTTMFEYMTGYYAPGFKVSPKESQ